MTVLGDVLVRALRQTHLYLEMKVDLVPPDALFRVLPGSNMQPIATIYAHTVLVEDQHVHRELMNEEPLFARPEWSTRIPFPAQVAQDQSWAGGFPSDLPLFREYAEAVYAASYRCLESAADADLQRPSLMFVVGKEDGRPTAARREMPAWFHFLDNVSLHTAEHTGDIGTLLGVQGLKASPWS
jgi:hypothetical protein